MLEFLAKALLAITIGLVFLVVVLIALAADLFERNPPERRRMQTHRAWNRERMTWS